MSRANVIAMLGALLLIACGAAPAPSLPGATSAPSAAVTAPPGSLALPTASAAPVAELPVFLMDFDRVCETQVGFGGAADFVAGPGIHPVILFADWGGEEPTLLESSATLPAGWKVTQDANFDDNSELALAQLVACARRTEVTPTGIMCDFTLSSGEDISLELTDTVYELSVYTASTGEQVGDTKILDASETECPFSAVFTEGDTKIFNDPTDDQYTTALKEFVAP